ncbi:crotonase/enoyl-CoA hydratase family protein [Aureimonas fodinaquatilis]|uniref:Crotonase/enoyl-CoA hydratase family protein n=1 Tax=Aureimonas fodinaquatilis TaxID=2565783 RepID=A0A5B0E080_9HYPH|nr:crotonase/enoyl-CoA hydratase family protein [Aureimonas fodinaquatilis]KAA0972467.1 crotonase/enoyl-CoA hydratase family protein [Aureimonas fodinaquatilis]
MANLVETALADGVLAIRLNRPDKKNALNQPMYAALTEAFAKADADAQVRAILMEGAPGAFCAGNDIADFASYAQTGEGIEHTFTFIQALGQVNKPLVAAVDGLAIGIGTTMLFHCDLVYAAPNAMFRTPFLDLGVVPEAGSSLLAPRIMGRQKAFSLLVMGDAFSATQAEAAGFVTAIVPSENLHETALNAAMKLAKKPPQALEITRNLLRGDRQDIVERIAQEAKHFEKRLKSQEAQAAFAAFMARSSSAARGG